MTASAVAPAPALRPPAGRIVTAAVLAHKPGVRTTTALEVAAEDGGRRTIVAKRFADRGRARRLFDALTDLRSDLDAAGADGSVPRPLALSGADSVVFYEAARGRFLDEATAAPGTFARCARALADVHACSPSLDRTFDPCHEARKVAGWAEEVGAALPSFGPRARRAALAYGASSRRIGLDTDVPVHKDLHHRHVVVGERTSFLDLDEVRWGDRAFDLAHMCTYAHLLAVRGEGAPAPEVEAEILSAYAAATGWAHDDRYALFCLYTCLKIAWHLATGRGLPPRPEGAEAGRQLAAVLAHAEARAGELA